MKYISLFEFFAEKTAKYWLLPLDSRYEDSLRKIGAAEKFIEYRLENRNTKNKYVFIGFDGDSSKYRSSRYPEDYWTFNTFFGSFRDEYYDKHKYNFEGGVNLTDDELLEIEAEKYNL